ncbi:MAG: carbohydrate kinase [Treponema sp.]|nr:carbohydrate kinase [Treponema sp.]
MIIACGEALIDMVPEKNGEGRDLYAPCPGGSPFNTAIAIGRLLGVENGRPRTAFLSRLSRDFFGEDLVRHLKQNGVSTELVTRSGETTTLAFVKLKAGEEPAYLFYTTGAADRSLLPEDIPAALPPEADCVLFGSISMTMEPSASSIENFILRESGRRDGPVISHDPNARPMMIPDREAYVRRFEGWVRSSSIVKISAADFDFIYPGLGLDRAVEKLLGMGPVVAAVTLGADGAMAVFKREGVYRRVTAPVVDLPVVDTIGAGDTFHGAFLAWLEEAGLMSRRALAALGEGELREALIFANKAASIVCSRRGANPPTLAEVKAL